MSYEQIQTGAIIRYPYLWARQAKDGETAGRKDRAVAVGVRAPRPDGDMVLLFPVTTREPEPVRFSAELPLIEKKRAGLDRDLRLWIILDEFNTDVIGRSFYLEAGSPLGAVEQGFLSSLTARIHRPAQGFRRGEPSSIEALAPPARLGATCQLPEALTPRYTFLSTISCV